MTNETNELDLVLEAVRQACGYDFRQYSRPTIRRRFAELLERSHLTFLSEMIPRILHDERFLDEVLQRLSITVTELFRDPSFYQMLRHKVLPVLKTLPNVKVWHAGCATGEEVYSLAILLQEEGLYDRTRIYATDFNAMALRSARSGIYRLTSIQKGTRNYITAGGMHSFADYYYAENESAKMHSGLLENVTFSHHNLAIDGAFGEMDLILCRNVMIYFDRTLQQRVFTLFHNSLNPGGFLCLGTKETLDTSDTRLEYEEAATEERIYRRLPTPVPPCERKEYLLETASNLGEPFARRAYSQPTITKE